MKIKIKNWWRRLTQPSHDKRVIKDAGVRLADKIYRKMLHYEMFDQLVYDKLRELQHKNIMGCRPRYQGYDFKCLNVTEDFTLMILEQIEAGNIDLTKLKHDENN